MVATKPSPNQLFKGFGVLKVCIKDIISSIKISFSLAESAQYNKNKG